ncbi:hypothetical protein FKM82_028410 [Ascaphus truei]
MVETLEAQMRLLLCPYPQYNSEHPHCLLRVLFKFILYLTREAAAYKDSSRATLQTLLHLTWCFPRHHRGRIRNRHPEPCPGFLPSL